MFPKVVGTQEDVEAAECRIFGLKGQFALFPRKLSSEI
jgi:hypothetical protein